MHRLNRVAAATFAAATVTAIGFCTPAYANASPHAAPKVVSAGAASTSTLIPAGLGACSGWNTYWLFDGYCSGTGPKSEYQAVAMCLDFQSVRGVVRWDGDVRRSVADCSNHGGLSGDWGFCLYYDGKFNKYDPKHGAGILDMQCLLRV